MIDLFEINGTQYEFPLVYILVVVLFLAILFAIYKLLFDSIKQLTLVSMSIGALAFFLVISGSVINGIRKSDDCIQYAPVIEVGGCNSKGICGVIVEMNGTRIKADAEKPVAGASACIEKRGFRFE